MLTWWLVALSDKLLQNLAELVLMLQNLLPDGRGVNNLSEGWEGSFVMEEDLKDAAAVG